MMSETPDHPSFDMPPPPTNGGQDEGRRQMAAAAGQQQPPPIGGGGGGEPQVGERDQAHRSLSLPGPLAKLPALFNNMDKRLLRLLQVNTALKKLKILISMMELNKALNFACLKDH
jgi:hypothetical protein